MPPSPSGGGLPADEEGWLIQASELEHKEALRVNAHTSRRGENHTPSWEAASLQEKDNTPVVPVSKVASKLKIFTDHKQLDQILEL